MFFQKKKFNLNFPRRSSRIIHIKIIIISAAILLKICDFDGEIVLSIIIIYNFFDFDYTNLKIIKDEFCNLFILTIDIPEFFSIRNKISLFTNNDITDIIH